MDNNKNRMRGWKQIQASETEGIMLYKTGEEINEITNYIFNNKKESICSLGRDLCHCGAQSALFERNGRFFVLCLTCCDLIIEGENRRSVTLKWASCMNEFKNEDI